VTGDYLWAYHRPSTHRPAQSLNLGYVGELDPEVAPSGLGEGHGHGEEHSHGDGPSGGEDVHGP
jgi:hypothetical protein